MIEIAYLIVAIVVALSALILSLIDTYKSTRKYNQLKQSL